MGSRFWEKQPQGKENKMRKKNYKGRCEKRKLPRFQGICRTYDPIQSGCAFYLSQQEEYKTIYCNVVLENVLEGAYMSDFVCVRNDGTKVVFECVYKKHLLKPMTTKLLDASRSYWLEQGVNENDWVLVVEKGGFANE